MKEPTSTLLLCLSLSLLAVKAFDYICKIQVCAQRTIESIPVYRANGSIILDYSIVLATL